MINVCNFLKKLNLSWLKCLSTDSSKNSSICHEAPSWQSGSEACGDIGEIGDITFLPFRYETVLN